MLFACDAGGNYLAFDYSNDKLNPSVVFIEHEELGIIEFPDGKSEHDFTKEELDRMMSSEKLEDYPWAIHCVANSFEEFIKILRFNNDKKYSNQTELFDEQRFEKYLKESESNIPKSVVKFIKKYGGLDIRSGDLELFNHDFLILFTINFNLMSDLDYYNFFEKLGGIEKYSKLTPLLYICYKKDVFDKSIVALINENDKHSIVIIPKKVLYNDKKLIEVEELIHVTDEVDLFIKKLITFFES
ncbi:hypothetical protein [Macrococcus armenti]|uniref:hypothetical protein n=1 Tax=Macrococcus armenti TaxID=2875764 RepID=UPI001CCC25BD|nr:hypothetical protein [Macrococcus armenti]UBH07734.1 hypothetical protein LAU41_06770 [Macrococcus armenti]